MYLLFLIVHCDTKVFFRTLILTYLNLQLEAEMIDLNQLWLVYHSRIAHTRTVQLTHLNVGPLCYGLLFISYNTLTVKVLKIKKK